MLSTLDAVDRAVETVVARLTANHGISRDQWRVLTLLADGEGHSMSEIAARTQMPSPSATRLVDAMSANALLYRRGDPLDRRRVLVHLSAAGRELTGRLDQELDAVLGPVLGAPELSAVVEVTEAVLRRVREITA
jgi:DNA-binding MarR family transcriptional regulator